MTNDGGQNARPASYCPLCRTESATNRLGACSACRGLKSRHAQWIAAFIAACFFVLTPSAPRLFRQATGAAEPSLDQVRQDVTARVIGTDVRRGRGAYYTVQVYYVIRNDSPFDVHWPIVQLLMRDVGGEELRMVNLKGPDVTAGRRQLLSQTLYVGMDPDVVGDVEAKLIYAQPEKPR